MNTLIVYDSWYGNTHAIARAVSESLPGVVTLMKAKDEPLEVDLSTYDLLIVGSPTHGGIATPAVQTFLNSLDQDDLYNKSVVVFDTRATMRWVKIIGFAAKRMANILVRKGAILAANPIGFYVHGKEGPLIDGELERAQAWAAGITIRTSKLEKV